MIALSLVRKNLIIIMIGKKSNGALTGRGLLVSSNVLFFAFLLLLTTYPTNYCYAQKASGGLSLVVGEDLGNPASHGVEILTNALKKLNVRATTVKTIDEASGSQVFLVGTPQNQIIKDLVASGELNLSPKKESLAIKKVKRSTKEILVIAGSDDRGLLYALTEAARQIESAGKAVSLTNAVAEVSETPEAP